MRLVPGSPTGHRSVVSHMFASGIPALAASGLVLLIPLSGRQFLTRAEYATWALLATVLTVSLVLDFGGPALILREESRSRLTRPLFIRAVGLSCLGSVGVAVIAAATWPMYSSGSSYAAPGMRGVYLFLICGAAGALRSAYVSALTIFQARRRHAVRGALLLGQAALQLVVTIVLLEAGAELWSLPAASIVSCILCLPMCMAVIRSLPPTTVSIDGGGLLRRFAAARFLVTVLGITLTQLDRWVIGIVGGSSFLANYDVNARIASVPRLIVISLAGVLVGEAARAGTSRSAVDQILARSTQLIAVTVVAGSTLVWAVAYLASDIFQSERWSTTWYLFIPMLIWYGLNALTAPVSLVATGVGRPGEELRYLVPCVTTTVLGWLISILAHSPLGAVVAVGISLAVWSVMFVIDSSRRITRGLIV